jgi:hypothetical protein
MRCVAGGRAASSPGGVLQPDQNPLTMLRPRQQSSPRAPRPHLFKCRLSDEEERIVHLRARGYPNPAEYGRRRLVAGWTLPMSRLATVTEAFLPIQRAIDHAAAAGHPAAADEATEALRRILASVSEP